MFNLSTDDRKALGVRELPSSLAEAMVELERDTAIKTAIGPVLFDAFHRSRWAEWDDYRIHVTDWEMERYLELA
jgi:glutamine synthetase